jgi:hypothetical protein
MRATPDLGKPASACLAQSMRGYIGAPSVDASRDRHRPVIDTDQSSEIKSYGEKADRKKAGLEQRP